MHKLNINTFVQAQCMLIWTTVIVLHIQNIKMITYKNGKKVYNPPNVLKNYITAM